MIHSSVSVVIFTKATSSWRGNIQFIKIHLDNFMITNETDLTTLKEAYALWGYCENFSTLKDFLSVINDSCWIRRSAFRTLLILVMKYVNLVDHVIKSRSKPFRIYLNSNLKPLRIIFHLIMMQVLTSIPHHNIWEHDWLLRSYEDASRILLAVWRKEEVRLISITGYLTSCNFDLMYLLDALESFCPLRDDQPHIFSDYSVEPE